MHTKFWLENLNIRDYSEDLGLDGRIMLKWMHLRDQWRALLNTVMKLLVS
jgi:hypothetical protein